MAARVAFEKYEGLGNDFLVVEAPSDAAVSPADARAWCDRRRGVGGDGVLLLLPPSPAGGPADGRMRVINADGSIAEMCGNGLRCAALHFARQRHFDRGELAIETDAGVRSCAFERHGDVATVLADMGVVRVLGDESLLHDGRAVTVTRVDAGNPHAVVFRRIAPGELEALGSPLSAASGANVEFTWPHDGAMEVLVWERGAGATLACGTGACAVVAAASSKGLVDGEVVRVRLPGGELDVRYDARTGRTSMRGPARRVFSGLVERVGSP
jgi:diaminopimelate epimerase